MTAALFHKTDEWHEQRRNGIGSSDAGIIMGVGLQTRYDLWKLKVGLSEPLDLSGNSAVRVGIVLEDAVADVAASDNPTWKIRKRSIAVHSKHYPFAYAHLDRILNDGEQAGIPFEIKTAGYPGEWGATGTSDIPHYYLPQIQHQLAATGKPYARLAVFILATREFRYYKIERNDAYIAALMETEAQFWECVLDHVEPEPMNAADVIARFPSPLNSIAADEVALVAAKRYKEINALLAGLEAEKEKLRDVLAVAMGECEALTANGKTIATFKAEKRTTIDSKRLAADQPETAAAYSVTTSSRKLLVK